MELHEKLRELRIDRDLTQQTISQKLKTSTQYYQKYEKGIHPIPVNHLKTLCEFYEVSADDLLDLPRNLPNKKDAGYTPKEFIPMTKTEIMEEYFKEMVRIFRGAATQGISGDELFAMLEFEAWKTKEELLNRM